MRPRFAPVRQRLRGWLRPVRTRLTLLATGLVTIALGIAAGVMVLALHHVLVRSADSATEARASQVAASVSAEGPAQVDPVLLAPADNVDVIQVVDGAGRVRITNSPDIARSLAPPATPGEQIAVHGAHESPSGAEYRVTALGVTTDDGPMTVVVGAAEAPINRLVLIVGILCCIVFPIIVIVMAVLTYQFVGRALRPVDDIRRRVDVISGGELTQRVPVPGTGDEIATLAATMNEMLDRIEAARTQQLQFVNDASHELNSPLTALVGLLDLSRATDQPIDPETVDSIMLPEALRLQQMVADLLLLARADESGVPLRLGEVDLDDVVGVEAARIAAVTDHVVDAQIVAVRVCGDAEKLGRAVRNLADNAAHYARGRMWFAMSHDIEAATVTVTVSDDGPGIPDADKGRVLHRFVRLDTVRDRARGGSGLGLSIVTEIVRAHHGHVIVGDAPGGGATVGFTIPTR